MSAKGDHGHSDGSDDLYDTLGVGREATDDEIATAYRRLAREHHPDANPEAEPGRFSGITDAYDVLSDPGRRQAYDRTKGSRARAARRARETSIPVHHRSRPAPDRAGADQIDLDLSFEQAALSTTVPVVLATDAACASCGATGATTESCMSCDGAGATTRDSGSITIRHVCKDCEGAGERPVRCVACDGTGHRLGERPVNVRVPAGVEDGAHLRVPISSDRALTAVVRVRPHEYFGRRGRDLTLDLPVTIAEAALGAVVTIPTLSGAVAIRIPPATPSGRVLRVRGRGIPFVDGPGDLLVSVKVVTPEDLNDDQRQALEAFAAATPSPRAHFERRAAEDNQYPDA